MLKDLFIIWIIFQLLSIGGLFVKMENEMIEGTFQCKEPQAISEWKGMLFPLAVFIPSSYEQQIKDYCDNQKLKTLK
jgi:hypothetical protein